MSLTSATQALPTTAASGRPSPEVTNAVRAASAESGVDFSYLLAKAAVESNFNPKAHASTSSAAGLFQFIDSTWMAMIRDHGAEHGYGNYAKAIRDGKLTPGLRREILDLRYDPKASAAMAAEYTRDNQEYLQRSVGSDIDVADLYLAHFLGAGGATRFLKALRANPDACAADLFPQAAQANKAVFYDHGRACSLAEIRDRFADKLEAYAAAADGEATQSDALLDSLYFPSVAANAARGGGLGDWAFLRPTGGARPLLPIAGNQALPGNLSFAVQTAVAALEAPGADTENEPAHRRIR